MKSTPHFVLFSGTREPLNEHETQGSSWYFRLESADGERFEASDVEFRISRERLELLAVVRGLEALDQPSSVTLITPSRQVSRAVRQGLEYWRVRNWKWERYGEKVPMKNGDLWQRVDRALQIHEVRCRTYKIEKPHRERPRPHFAARNRRRSSSNVDIQHKPSMPLRPVIAATRWTAHSMHWMANGLQRLIPDAAPNASPSL